MTTEEFTALKAKAAEEIKFDKTDAMEKCQNVPSLYQHWLDVFNRESAKYAQLQLMQEKMYGELYEIYKYNKNLKWETQKEIESQIKRNENYVKLAVELAKQKVIVDWLQETLGNINRLGFSINSYLNFLKYQGGFGM